ncbi:hypothetical protein KSP39_PZI018050 [Platanthera zijinensis]|uniref:SAWADEE domain-containing protein n=1 Tax=Platanthera zijinensis TaxID=2320716 RepID=A0AAP0FYU3_9ASPA
MSAKHPSQAAELLPLVEFRAADDDAWYSVRLRLADHKLRIMYCEFSEASDVVFSAESFPDLESIEKFRQRFRHISMQLQDRDCDRIVKGMQVCASQRFGEEELKFYDAAVQSVNPSIHPLQEGQCRCKFELLWQHGPLNGKKSIVGIADLCLITSQVTVCNLILEKFLDTVKEKLLSKIGEQQNMHDFSPVTVSTCTNQIPSSPIAHKLKKSQQHFGSSMDQTASLPDPAKRRLGETERRQREDVVRPRLMRALESETILKSTARGRSSNESMDDNLEQDVDMGGQSLQKCIKIEKKRTFYFCRIDNLEKDLSPFTLMHFIHEHLGITCSAIVYPSTSHEFCTRGFILVDGSHQYHKLMGFLLNREYFIVSLRGRPWVVDMCCGTTKGVMPTYEVNPSDIKEELPVQIKLVHKGAEEFEKIFKLHSLYSEFLEDVNCILLGRLLAAERTLMKQFDEK